MIVPARNEEATLGGCLRSLAAQMGVGFELIVVDDGSWDRTRAIAESVADVQVLSAGPLTAGWTGKNNALAAGARVARAPWLLFTDADTVHEAGSLARAWAEAEETGSDMLSYSPRQEVGSFTERAVMPVIFAELAAAYPLRRGETGADPRLGVAANGQYILVRRGAYDRVGGHASVAGEILEDVALARRFQDAALRVYFRYGGDAVRTRMYRNWVQLREGWTKNLVLLFPRPWTLAARSLVVWAGAWLGVAAAAFGVLSGHMGWLGFAVLWIPLYWRIRGAHFTAANCLIATVFGPPLFAFLILRSKRARARGRVLWKGREYGPQAAPDSPATGK